MNTWLIITLFDASSWYKPGLYRYYADCARRESPQTKLYIVIIFGGFVNCSPEGMDIADYTILNKSNFFD